MTIVGGKYSKWIVILQEFDLEIERAKSNKYFMFVELICDLPSTETETMVEDYFPNKYLFFISSNDIWYGDIITYLQTQTFRLDLSRVDHH
jgi:hypothetical protein